ncbi:MAG: hypothetical protein H7X99_06170 [Saprospiraceae bacterium]|nr:hypothetical protein [Saprospiraceae bacterium]
MLRICTLTLVLVSLCCFCHGQINRPDDQQTYVVQDTLNENDTIINRNGFFSLFKGKPGNAALYSLLIPGGGQAYNKKWWKVPLAVGIDGGLTYLLLWNTSQYNTSQALYLQAVKDDDPLKSRLKSQRDFYRKNKEYSWVWLIAGHLITVVDAFVDRHLLDFDVSDDLTINGYNTEVIPMMATLGFHISLNKKTKTIVNPLFPATP